MTIANAFVLGIVQGLTEFLPVSSSGHLVLAEHLLGLQVNLRTMQSMNIILHAGTLLALLLCYPRTWMNLLLAPFRKDEQHTKLLILIILASVPAGVIGLLFADHIAMFFQSVQSVALALIITGAVLIVSDKDHPVKQVPWWKRWFHRAHKKKEGMHILGRSALIMGCAQAFAIVPGLSRSGLTISAGRLSGVSRRDALDFSFLMAVPIFAGATLLTIFDVTSGAVTLPSIQVIFSGFLASLGSSILAIIFLRKFVQKYSLAWFAVYLIPIGIVLLFVS